MQIGIHHRADEPLTASMNLVCDGKETGIFASIEIREGDRTCCTLYSHDPETFRQIARVCEAEAAALEKRLTEACDSVKD